MMPIGTPRVPYRVPGEGTWQWVDLWNALVSHYLFFYFTFCIIFIDQSSNLLKLSKKLKVVVLRISLRLADIYMYMLTQWLVQYRERVIFIGQNIDEEFSNQILATMLYLDSVDNSKRMYMYINGPGGDVSYLSENYYVPLEKIYSCRC